jgi:hypothetical protein
MIDGDDCRAISGMNECQGKPKYSEKPCPSAALSTTDPTGLDPGSNPVHRRWKPAADRLSYGAASNKLRYVPRYLVPVMSICAEWK